MSSSLFTEDIREKFRPRAASFVGCGFGTMNARYLTLLPQHVSISCWPVWACIPFIVSWRCPGLGRLAWLRGAFQGSFSGGED